MLIDLSLTTYNEIADVRVGVWSEYSVYMPSGKGRIHLGSLQIPGSRGSDMATYSVIIIMIAFATSETVTE